MREYIMPVIAGLVIITVVLLMGINACEVVNCDNYESLTGIKTVMIKGKCHMYVDGHIQIVKELE